MQYHEKLLIHPLFRVPPTKAIAVTFVRFWLDPLKEVGSGVGDFIEALLEDLPLTLYPVAILFVVSFSFIFITMWFGYSIQIPFLLTIEQTIDRTQQSAVIDKLQTLLDNAERLNVLINALPESTLTLLKTTDNYIADTPKEYPLQPSSCETAINEVLLDDLLA